MKTIELRTSLFSGCIISQMNKVRLVQNKIKNKQLNFFVLFDFYRLTNIDGNFSSIKSCTLAPHNI